MELHKLENRAKWVLEIDGHSYVREQIDWNNNDDKPQSVVWHLNEDQKKGVIYLTDDILEQIFWENNCKPNLDDSERTIIGPENVNLKKQASNIKTIQINVPEGKKIIKTELEDGLLITFEDEYINLGNGIKCTRVCWDKALDEYMKKLKDNPIYYGKVTHFSNY